MKVTRILMSAGCVLLLLLVTGAQTTNKHFAKDGLSFDYPTDWQLADQSTAQMQFIQLVHGDLEIRIRSPREWLKNADKETAARKLMQDQYVDRFVDQLQQAGMNPRRETVTTQIAGADAQGARIRALLDGAPGGMDSYYRVVSDRFVQLSVLGSEKDIAKGAAAWDLIRNSLQVEAPPQPQPKASPQPSPAKKP